MKPRTWISAIAMWPELLEERGQREASRTVAFDTLRLEQRERPFVLRIAAFSYLCPKTIKRTWADFDALRAAERRRRRAA